MGSGKPRYWWNRPSTSRAKYKYSPSSSTSHQPTLSIEHLERREMLAADSLGTEFWLTFQRNFDNGAARATQQSLFLTSSIETTAQVEIPGIGFLESRSVVPGVITTVAIPTSALTTTTDGIADLGIHVTSTEEVAVYGLNYRQFSTDAFVGLPTDILSDDYLVLSYTSIGDDAGRASQFAVVATEDDTRVTVVPSVSAGSRAAGVAYEITLNEGQVYQLSTTNTGRDLTGTSVTSDKPIALFSGNGIAQVPVGVTAADHLVEQIPPTVTWGSRFVTVPLAQRTGGDVFRVLASEDATSVVVDDVAVAELDRGQFYEFQSRSATAIETSKPALVAQYATGVSFDSTTGDPFMAIVPPVEQLLQGYTLSTPAGGFDSHYINLWVPTQAIDSVQLDGFLVDPSLFTPIGSSGFSSASVSVAAGTHTVAADAPLGALIYGFGNSDSYGYTGGSSLVPIGDIASVEIGALAAALQDQEAEVSALVTDDDGNPVFGVRVDFTVDGPNATTGVAFTRFDGTAVFRYVGSELGIDSITATAGSVTSPVVQLEWLPLPDLDVTSIDSVGLAKPGEQINVSWSVTNAGQGVAPGDWRDSVYLSSDQVLDDSDVLLVSVDSGEAAPLDPLSTYDRTASIGVPAQTAFGDYYVIVAADDATMLPETSETNNTAATPISVSAADLVVSEAGPALATAGDIKVGQDFSIEWTVRNDGPIEARESRVDRIWLSSDALLDAGDILLGDLSVVDAMPLAAGATYTRSAVVSLPLSRSLAPGEYRLIVEADADNRELELSDTNNWTPGNAFSIEYPPLPDLAVSGVRAPIEAFDGQGVTVTWTVENRGNGDFAGEFSEVIGLAETAEGVITTTLGEFEFVGSIPSGQSVTRTQVVTLPEDVLGDRHVIVTADPDDNVFEEGPGNNNRDASDELISIARAPVTNLVVAEVMSPVDAFSGQQTAVSWTVENTGTRPTSAPIWFDAVYLSTDPVLDLGVDIFLGQTANLSYLDSGESYRVEDFSVTLPRGINGPHYFIVQTDFRNQVRERSGEGDNTAAGAATAVTLTPPPDLQVEAIRAPATRISGESMTIDYDIINAGEGATRTESWSDRVFLSTDDVFDPTDRLVATVPHSGALECGEGYTASADFVLPIEITGDVFFFVQTDAFNQVFEHVFEFNNTEGSETTTNVLQGALPDLEVVDIASPSVARSGEQLAIEYTVANLGQFATRSSSWVDRVYLSVDDQLNTSEDFFLGATSRFGTLLADGTEASEYVATVNRQLPNDLTGEFYVFVVTNAGGSVLEISDSNNTLQAAEKVAIVSEPADLSVTTVSTRGVAQAGTATRVSWSVENVGSGDTIVSSWRDQVVLSRDEVLGNRDDRVLATRTHSGLVDAGGSYSVADEQVTIPFDVAPGDYQLFVRTDSSGQVFESDDDSNNISSPASVTVVRDTPDLRVTEVTAPAEGRAGELLDILWSVENVGVGPTNANFWSDRVYLSRDGSVSPDDILLGQIQRTNPLGVGGSYQQDRTFAVPLAAVGDYFVLVVTDASDHVVEGASESGNTTASASVVTIAAFDPEEADPDPNPNPNDPERPRPPADLVVSDVAAPANGVGGQRIDISWTVENTAFATSASWFDSVYLSLDQVFNPDSDIYLGFANRPNGLGTGESYQQTASFTLPRGVAGPYYVFVRADGNNRVPELDAVLNNVAYDASPIEIALPPLVDLTVGTVTVPANATLNQTATIEYSVQNLSTTSFSGSWTDRVYLSADDQWDVDDRLFGSVAVSASVGAEGSYTRSLEAPLPGVVAGEYHVIVRSDILNQVPESVESNNLAASLDRTSISVEELVLGSPVAATLERDQALFYRVDVAEGETLLLTLESDDPDAVNELYVSFDQAPTRSQSDFAFTEALAPNQRVVVPFTEAGTYYVLAYSQQLAGLQSVTIEANTIDFTVFDESFGRGGNVGNRTIEINGAKFDRTIEARLLGPDGSVLDAVQMWPESPTQAYATFDLRGLQPGSYGVEVATDTSGSIVVDSAFEVVAGGGGANSARIEAPERVRAGVFYDYSFFWANDGLNDIGAPFILVGNTVPLLTKPGGDNLGEWYEFIGINENGGPAGILKPGDFGRITLFSQADFSEGENLLLSTRQLTALDEPFDWQAVAPGLRPINMSSEVFDSVFPELVARVGATNGDVLQVLSRNASLAVDFAGEFPTLYDLLGIELRYAHASLGNSISGSVRASSFATSIANNDLTLQNAATGEYFSTSTYKDGSFVLAGLPAGTYTATFEGGVLAEAVIELTDGQQISGLELAATPGARIAVAAAAPASAVLTDLTIQLYSEGGELLDTAFLDEGSNEAAFNALRHGTYVVRVAGPGVAAQILETVEVGDDDVYTPISLAEESTISGSVVLSATAEQAQVTVIAVRDGGHAIFDTYSTTLKDGAFSLEGLPSGAYRVAVLVNNHEAASIDNVVIGDGEHLSIGTVGTTETSAVAGIVDFASGVTPGAELVVALESDGRLVEAVPVIAGGFLFAAVPAGAYTLALRGQPEGDAAPVQITVVEGEQLSDVRVAVTAGSIVTGTVVEPDGQLGAGITVFAFGPGDVVVMAETDATGEFALTGLRAGQYAVYTRGMNSADATNVEVGKDVVVAGVELVAERAPDELEGVQELIAGHFEAIPRLASVRSRRIQFALPRFSVFGPLLEDRNHVETSDLPEVPAGCTVDLSEALRAIQIQDRRFAEARELYELRDEVAFWHNLALLDDIAELTGAIGAGIAASQLITAYAFGASLSAWGLGTQGSILALEASLFAADLVDLWDITTDLRRYVFDNEDTLDGLESAELGIVAADRTLNGVSKLRGTLGDIAGDVRYQALPDATKGLLGAMGSLVDAAIDIVQSLDFGPTVETYRLKLGASQRARSAFDQYQLAIDGALEQIERATQRVASCEDEKNDEQPETPDFPPRKPMQPGDIPKPERKPQPFDPNATETPDDDSPVLQQPVRTGGGFDPNDILGPEGFGEQRFVPASEPLDYRIRFENDPVLATAPAQLVQITQTLDSDLDPRSFRLGDFGFGEFLFEVPDNRAVYTERLDLREEYGIFVDVTAAIDVASGEAFWELRSIDPETGDLPIDPGIGFLPPNMMPPEGDGFVTYSVRPRRSVKTGDVIDAQARIIFDINEPIDTPPIFNTIDASAPFSQADALPANVPDREFEVSWGGLDEVNGSAVANYTVYVSKNDAPFEVWLLNTELTSGLFVGEEGSRYRFYTVSGDNAGNIEEVPTVADAETNTPGPAPVVLEGVVQNGDSQRSFVNTWSLSFDREMDLQSLIDDGTIVSAFLLINFGVDVVADADTDIALSAADFSYSYDTVSGESHLVWTRSGGVSLPEGVYRLDVDGGQLSDLAGVALDGDGDGTAGGRYSLAFHRLVGDTDGDQTVRPSDAESVNAALGSSPGSPGWDPNADLDGDGRITVRDRVLAARSQGSTIVVNSQELPGDFNRDGVVNAADYTVWRDSLRATDATASQGDATGEGLVDEADYAVWRGNYGATAPEKFVTAVGLPEGSLVATVVSTAAPTSTAVELGAAGPEVPSAATVSAERDEAFELTNDEPAMVISWPTILDPITGFGEPEEPEPRRRSRDDSFRTAARLSRRLELLLSSRNEPAEDADRDEQRRQLENDPETDDWASTLDELFGQMSEEPLGAAVGPGPARRRFR
jgi:hypothetical protein